MNLKIKTRESSKKNSLKIAFLLYFLISVQFVFAQNQTIDLNMTDKPLSEIFKSIEKQADISVDFDETQINIHQKISVNIKNKKLTDALSMILSPLKYKYAKQGKHVIITNEKNRQKSESIVGFVKNPNGEPLIGASVLVKGTNNAVSTEIDSTSRGLILSMFPSIPSIRIRGLDSWLWMRIPGRSCGFFLRVFQSRMRYSSWVSHLAGLVLNY